MKLAAVPHSSNPSPRRFWLVALAVLAWLLCTSGLRPLMLPDEGRYVGGAWEMLRAGQWSVPLLDGLPFFHKPPLFYWITAASLALFGPHEWAGRVAPLLGAALAALSSYRFLLRWAPSAAPRVLPVLLTQPLVFLSAQYANHDMLVAGCITACTLALAGAVLRLDAGLPHRRVLTAAWLFAGLGVLAKGLIGFALPALAIFVWLLATRRWRRVPALLWWPGPLLFAVVVLPWFVAMQLRYPDFLHYFFVVQQFQRYADQGFNNAQPLWFYPAVLALGGLPWSLWVPLLLRRSGRQALRGPLAPFLALWCLSIVGFFSLPQSKIVGYVLPAVPPLACLIAMAVPAAGPRQALWWRVSLALGVLGCLGMVAVLALRPPASNRALGRVLAAQRAPEQPVLVIGRYPYDLMFYGRLTAPVPVYAPWDRSKADTHDDWQREMADAERFAPDTGRALLRPLAAVPQDLCRAPVSWVVGPRALPDIFKPLAGVPPAAVAGDSALWRAQRSALVAAGLRCATS